MAPTIIPTLIGILGNILSILLFSSSLPTFWRIASRRSTENFKGFPYICTLLSTSLWSYYGLLKPGGILILTINIIGTIFQVLYLTIFLLYAPKRRKIRTALLTFLFDVVFLGIIVAITMLASNGSKRLLVVGTICSTISVSMYASPMVVLGTVVRTKSVEFMPFFLSLFLLLNAGCWSLYAILVKDIFVEVPNVIGFFLGAIQLVVYIYYRNISQHKDIASNDDQKAIPTIEIGRSLSLPKQFNFYKTNSYTSSSRAIVKQQSLPSKIIKASSMTIIEILNFLQDNDPMNSTTCEDSIEEIALEPKLKKQSS